MTYQNLHDKLQSAQGKINTLDIKISKFFTDVDGTIIDQNTLPVNLQQKLPVFLFGSFDAKGGYRTATEQSPPFGWNYWTSYVQGVNAPFLQWTGLNEASTRITTGDMVSIYSDDLINPTFFAWIITSETTASIGSIVHNASNLNKNGDQIKVDTIKYFSPNLNQYHEGLKYIVINNIGYPNSDVFTPFSFKSPMDKQDSFIDLNISFTLTQYILFTTYITFDTQLINFNILIRSLK